VCAYPLFEPWAGEMGLVSGYEALKDSVEADIVSRVNALADEAGVSYAMLHSEEGHVTHAITGVAEITRTDIVCLGTHAREGIRGAVFGNTSEKILHAVGTDGVTVIGT